MFLTLLEFLLKFFTRIFIEIFNNHSVRTQIPSHNFIVLHESVLDRFVRKGVELSVEVAEQTLFALSHHIG